MLCVLKKYIFSEHIPTSTPPSNAKERKNFYILFNTNGLDRRLKTSIFIIGN